MSQVESYEKKTLRKIPERIFILFMTTENMGLKTVIMAIMFLLADDYLDAIMKKLWDEQMLIGASGKIFFKKYVQDHSHKFYKYQIKITFPGKVLKKESIKTIKHQEIR